MKKVKCKFFQARPGQRKIQISVILLVLFCLSPLLAAPCGDVNSNGVIDIVDALLIAQYYVGLDPPNFDESAADVTGDGVIDIVDALLIAQYYVGLIDELPGCESPPTATPVPTPSPTPESIMWEIQAEDGTWDDASVDTDYDGYTGTGFVNTANSAGTWIEWSIKAEDTCNVTYEFRYACYGSARPMDLSINGSVKTTLHFPESGGWAVWNTETADVTLDAGLNVIRLTATGSSGGPNIDKLDLTTGCTMITPVLFKWTAENVNSDNWTLDGWAPAGGVIKLNFEQTDFGEMISPHMHLNAGIYDTIYLRMRNTSDVSRLQLEYKTEEIQEWDQGRLIEIVFRNSGKNFTDYKIDLNNVSKWSGIVTQLKLSPSVPSSEGSGSMEIEYLHFTYNTYPDDINIYWESTQSMDDPALITELKAIGIFNYNESGYSTIQDVINRDPLTDRDSGFADSARDDLANLYDEIDFQGLFNTINNYPGIEIEVKPKPDAEYISCVNFYLEEKIKDLIDPGNPNNPERENEKRQVYWQKLLHTLCGILSRKWIEIRPGKNISDIIITPNARLYGNDNALIDGGPEDFQQPDTEGANDFLFGTWKEPTGPLHSNIENPPNRKTIKVFILDSIPTIQLQDFNRSNPSNQDLIDFGSCENCITKYEYEFNGRRFDALEPELNSEDEEIVIPGDLSNHGLFSAGIVYGITKHVEIELIEILNKKCVGNLFSLMWGFYKIQEILSDESYNDIYIINCSFMCRHPLREFQDDFIESTGSGGSYPPFINPTSYFFRKIFNNMHDLSGNPDPKGIICCAAGNNYHSSTSQQTYIQNGSEPEVADYYPMAPASFDNTIGIGAFYINNNNMEPAAYSRVPGDGGYWAMGGDYDPDAYGSDLQSQTLLSFYVSDYLPMTGRDNPEIPNQNGWVRGTGTSFATAVASGIFAIYSSLYTDTQTVKAEVDNHSHWWNYSTTIDDSRATGDDKILHVVQGKIRDSSPIQIPAGSYYVGDNPPPGSDNVFLNRNYYITETEVTYELWSKVYTWATGNGYKFAHAGTMGGGTGGKDRQHPVTNVNWRDCMVWTNALSEKKGLTPCYTNSSSGEVIKDSTNATVCDNAVFNYDANGYRLPTEVEWEIAARGGSIAKKNGTYETTYSGSDKIDDVAWYAGNSGGLTHVVGTRDPNELGLYDMSGNVLEWCWDLYEDSSPYPSVKIDPVGALTGTGINHILRGGGWYYDASYCDVSFRNSYPPGSEGDPLGFRLVRNE